MDKEICSKIFDPFFTTKGNQGTGLGLSQVYGFVERSSGAINVKSEPDKGSCFSLYFPRYETNDEINTAGASNDTTNNDLRGNETLLIVDDEEPILHLSKEFLSSEGYTVICAGSGDEALEKLALGGVELMLSDVIMPSMDGYELASKVSDLYPEVKIQLVSGYTDDREPEERHAILRDQLIYKPYSTKELLGRIRNLLDA